MTAHRPMRLHGQRIAGPAGSLDIVSGSELMNDPRRGCAPDNLDTDPDVFFSKDPYTVALAKSICRPCPARYACVAYALDRDEKFGVWGRYDMSSIKDRRRAAAQTGTQPRPKPPTASELRAQRVADAQAETAKVEQEIRELWQQGRPDSAIALTVGLHPGAIGRIRRRLGLPSLYGPGGQRIHREQVSA